MTKLILAVRNFANAPKLEGHYSAYNQDCVIAYGLVGTVPTFRTRIAPASSG